MKKVKVTDWKPWFVSVAFALLLKTEVDASIIFLFCNEFTAVRGCSLKKD